MSWAREQQNDVAFEILQRHVANYNRNFTSQGKQPRDKDWRPVRFAVRNVIIAWVVARLQSKDNVIEVDVCMTYDPEAIPGRSGTKFAAIYILSQSYKSGSSMGIRFTQNVEGGTVPVDIVDMAHEYGVELKNEHIYSGVITPKEARQLYIALTEVSDDAQAKIMELSVGNKVSPERICYMVHHSTYTKEEMESLLVGTEFPEHILIGKVDPSAGLLYSDMILRGRDIVLGGMLDRTLKLKEVVGEDGKAVDLEADDRQVKISFDPRFFAKIYETLEETPVPWTIHQGWKVKEGQRLVVLVRGRDWSDFKYYFDQDLEALEQLMQAYSDKPSYFLMLVPRDVLELPSEELDNYRRILREKKVVLMICPDSIALLDKDIVDRLRESETMRHDVGSGEKVEDMKAYVPTFDFNSTEIRIVAVPRDLVIGRLSLSELTKQALYDENELLSGVNKHNVRSRYYLVCDRMQFLAHLALLDGKYQSASWANNALEVLALFWVNHPDKAGSQRVMPVFWMPEHTNRLKSALFDLAKEQGLVIIAVQNKHSTKSSVQGSNVVSVDQLTQTFSRQFVPDWVNDYGNAPFREVVIKNIWDAVRAAKRGQTNAVNLGEVPHMIVTQSLHRMVYDDPKKVDGQSVSINIVYTDGSQSREFPLFVLQKRTRPEVEEFRNNNRVIKVGMVSMRHPEMDTLVDQYWFRNIEVSQPGMTSSEVDELCYQVTLKKLGEIYSLNQPIRVEFYQTGLPPAIIGFWRAVVEFLKVGQGKPPMLEITPMIFDKRSNGYEAYEPWI